MFWHFPFIFVHLAAGHSRSDYPTNSLHTDESGDVLTFFIHVVQLHHHLHIEGGGVEGAASPSIQIYLHWLWDVHMQKNFMSGTSTCSRRNQILPPTGYTTLVLRTATPRRPTPPHAPRNHSQLPRHLRPFKQHTLDSTGSGSAGSKMSGWISEGFSAEGVSLRVWLRVHVVGFVWVEPHADSTPHWCR